MTGPFYPREAPLVMRLSGGLRQLWLTLSQPDIWLIEYGLTSHQTHYRSYGDGFLRVKWPNQQCQSTEGKHKTANLTLVRESRTLPITAPPVLPHNDWDWILLNVADARIRTSNSSLNASSAMTASAAEPLPLPPSSWPSSSSSVDFFTDFIFFWKRHNSSWTGNRE